MTVKIVDVAIQFPDVLDGNEGNIYIAKTTPPSVVKLYQEQFQKDLILFLELRYEELAFDGQMVLTFLGRKEDDVYSGSMNYLYELLAQSLQSLVEKDLVNQKKLNSFNLPIYGASVAEVKEVVNQSGRFDINHINLFESNWDP
ncbi:anthranilate O-methyltransferase 1-like [Panicum miliaceum]|uniref:Anthranilate O-methyltransferase 1-like n=1 Tax=Panicum miliaceum TaxID=4540 RepID=A0A3L6S160_PANMI|nr:anthranilate O-methyltransferase 1-like [Panicum miliaceum]